MKVFFRQEQNSENNVSFSPSANKPLLFVNRVRNLGGIEIVSSWNPVSRDDFYLVHEKEHVDSVLDCKKENGFSNTLKEVSDSLYYTTGSFYAAAKEAIYTMVSISPTSGFHHASYDKCMGFCTFNGLMVSAVLLKDAGIVKRIGIVDFDMHWGNGTVDIINKKHINYISHMAFSDQVGNNYTNWLNNLRCELEIKMKECDLVFYQAGADPHIDDPLGRQLTTDQMKERDRIVFKFCKDYSIPIVWNLAGGYQTPVSKVVDIHVNTLYECMKVYNT